MKFYTLLLCFTFLCCNKLKANDSCIYYINEARSLMATSEYEKAIVLIDKCILLDGKNAYVYSLKGCATIFRSFINDEKNNKLAVILFSKAIELDSSKSEYYNNRGWAYQNIDKLLLSYADYKKALSLDTNNLISHHNILRNLWIRNKYKDAYAYSEIIITKFPNNGYAYHVRGNLKRDYLHKYKEGNIDIKISEKLKWNMGEYFIY
jgi:tetratricopeptide (TPR) repeat protein